MLDGDEIRDESQEELDATQVTEPPPPGLWQRIRGAFSAQERWAKLNWAIAAYPDVPANYLLRGELLLKQGDTHGAMMDFRHALELSTAAVEQDDWAIAAQAAQDRALKGLQDAVRRAARYNSGTERSDNR